MTQELVKEEDFIIPVDSIFSVFENHLQIKGNSRIMFSGKFGIGKTFFLNEFFEKNKEKYDVYHLFPVNYQIASNEDIFDFLKSDILVELNKKGVKFKEEDYWNFIDIQNLLYLWASQNKTKISKNAVSFIPALGRPLKETIQLMSDFSNFFLEVQGGDKKKVEDFINKVKEKKPSETDILSELISQKIIETKNEKESVLILDDLERIDPEHIFRILNVLSAHLESDTKEILNKFGFDKIILVADYSSLKSIFHHRYGEDTNSDGYFDKFFTFEPFSFDNKKIIFSLIDEIISRFRISDIDNFRDVMAYDGMLRVFLREILEKIFLNKNQLLSLRNLLKPIKFQLSCLERKISNGFGRQKSIINNLNLSIKIFITIFGSADNFLFLLKQLSSKELLKEENSKDFYDEVSSILLQNVSSFSYSSASSSGEKYFYVWNGYSCTLLVDRIESVKKNDKGVRSEDLFYDLLIKYIELNKYS